MALTFKDDAVSRLVSRLDDSSLATLRRFVGDGEIVAKADPYYSKVRVEWQISGTAWTLPVFSLQAFQYGRSESMAPGGFATNTPSATLLDTNIQTRGETNGEVMLIQSVGVVLDPDCDPVLARKTLPRLTISAGFGGDDQAYKWGPLLFYPGGAGLTGGGLSPLAVPNFYDANAVVPAFPGMGMPYAGNMRELQETIAWYPKGGGTAEQNFAVTVRNPRALSFTAPAARTGTSTLAGSAPPTTTGSDGSFVEFWIKLEGYQLAPRTKNR